jgi:chaperonin GroEL
MILNKQQGDMLCVGVRAPEVGLQRHLMLQDIALLTGARCFDSKVEGSLRDIRPADFGSARRAWADPEHYAIIGAGGDPSAVRKHMRTLRRQLRAEELGSEERERLAARLGKLTGGVCVLKIGAIGERELEARKQMALDAIASARAAMEEGVVPGGGAAYVHCAGELANRQGLADQEERYGLLALAHALCAPAAAIARNSGYPPSTVLARLRDGPAGYGFDARTGQVVSMWDAGIVDPVQVLRVALQMAVSAASMALTTEALVLTRKPESEPFGDIGSDTLEP